jgi:RNA recognition motif-containing protein
MFSAAPPGGANAYSGLSNALVGGMTGGMGGNYAAMLPSAGMMQMVDPSTKSLRELYIGNLPSAIMEFQPKDFLGQCIMQAELNTMPGTSIINCRVSGKFAFAEFRSIEEANLAMNLKGAICQGSVIDVKRPGKYTGPPTPHVSYGEYCAKNKKELFSRPNAVGLPEGGLAAAQGMGDPDTKILRELYIGNVPPGMSEHQLQEFFNGQMKARHLNQGPGNPCIQTRISQGFAFAEFRSVFETNLAAAQLNNVIVQGAQLRVGRPKKYEDTVPLAEQQKHMREGQEGAGKAAVSAQQEPTICLQLSNMISSEEIIDKAECEDIIDDVKMGKF